MTTYTESFSTNLNSFQIYGTNDVSISSGQLAKAGTGETRLRKKPSAWLPEEDQKLRMKYTTSSTLVGRYGLYAKCDADDPSTCDRARAIVDISAQTVKVDVQNDGSQEEMLAAVSIGAHNTSAAHWLELEFADNQFAVRWGKLDPASNPWTYDSGFINVSPTDNRASTRFIGRFGKYAAGHVGILFNPGSASHRIDDFTLVDADNPLNPPPILGASADYSIPVPYNWDDGWPPADWRPFDDENVWNKPLPAMSDRREHPDSDTIIQTILDELEDDAGDPVARGPAHMLMNQLEGEDFGKIIYFAKSSDPLYTVSPEHPPTGYWQDEEWPWTGYSLRAPEDAQPSDGGDKHFAVVQPNGMVWDFYKAVKDDDDHTLVVRNGGRYPSIYARDSHLSFGAVAAETVSFAGCITPEELREGYIPHALHAFVDGVENPPQYPAFHSALSKEDAIPPITAQRLWTGSRLYLDYSDAEIVGLGLPDWQAAVVTALAHYGAIVMDTSGVKLGLGSFYGSNAYESFGYDNPYENLGRELYTATTPNVVFDASGRYVLLLREDVDWDGHLKVLDPMLGQKYP